MKETLTFFKTLISACFPLVDKFWSRLWYNICMNVSMFILEQTEEK